MKASFNVLSDPWIPVVNHDGTRELLGLRETLQRASELREISDTSPLEEYALYRFLCVFLMDALRPQDEWDIKKIINEGKFDMAKIETYIKLCESEGVSFDLFDEHRPFMQMPYVEKWDKQVKSIANIDCFMPSGNNHVHFDHKWEGEQSIPVDRAARLLLVIQHFCTASVQGYPSGINGAPPYFGVIKGKSLQQTLAYALMPIEEIEIPFDEPPVIWRATEDVQPKKIVEHTSWLRGMLFPARRVRFFPPADGKNVTHMNMSQGENFLNTTNWTDPFVFYIATEKGRIPFRPRGEKAIWQSLCNIVDTPNHNASQLLEQLVRLVNPLYIKITLYGVEIKPGKVIYINIKRHDLRFRNEITENEQIISLLKRCVTAAEQIGKRLNDSLRNIGVMPNSATTEAENQYYKEVEACFWRLCDDISASNDMDRQYLEWCNTIGRYARKTFYDILLEMNLRGREMAIAAEQEKWLNSMIKKVKTEGGNESEGKT